MAEEAAVVATVLRKKRTKQEQLAGHRDKQTLSRLWSDFWSLKLVSSQPAASASPELDQPWSDDADPTNYSWSSRASLPVDVSLRIAGVQTDAAPFLDSLDAGPQASEINPNAQHGPRTAHPAGTEPVPTAGDHIRPSLPGQDEKFAYHNLLSGLRERYTQVLMRRRNYVNLISFIVFTTFYAAIVSYQRQAFLGYNIRNCLTRLLPGDGDGGVVSDFRSITDVHTWINSTVESVWIDPICGNGVCDIPFDEAAYGRFGCQEDCGWREDLLQVTINLSYKFYTESARESSLWNICREDQCSLSAIDPISSSSPHPCFFLNAGRFTNSEGKIDAIIYLPLSSKWEFCLATAAPVVPVAGTISQVYLSKAQRAVKRSDPLGYLGAQPFEIAVTWYGNVSSSAALKPRALADASSSQTSQPTNKGRATSNLTLGASGKGSTLSSQSSAASARLAGEPEAIELQSWTHGGMVPPCLRDCLAASACLVRCEWLHDTYFYKHVYLYDGLEEQLYDPATLVELCKEQAGCDTDPNQRLPLGMVDCHDQRPFLDWLLLGLPYDGRPDTPLLQGGHNATWFNGSEGDVARLGEFLSWCDQWQRWESNACAPGCPIKRLGNGVCDDACLTEACDYDLTDCCDKFSYDGNFFYGCLLNQTNSLNELEKDVHKFNFTVPSEMDLEPIGANGTAGDGATGSSKEEDGRWRMAGVTNRIIAGIMIKQHRTMLQPLDPHKKFQTLFNVDFAGQEDARPFGANPRFTDASPKFYKPELRNLTSDFFTSEQLSKQGIPLAFFPVHHRGKHIFPVFIDIGLTKGEALMWVDYLKEASFLDSATEEVEVEIVTYNGILEYFGLLAISFRRQPGGTVLIRSTIQVFSLNMYNAQGERVRAVGEVLLVLMVIAGTYFELKQMASAAKAGRLWDYFANVANFIDFVSISLFYVCIALWTYFLVRYHGKFDIALSYQPYRTHFGSDKERLAKMLELADAGAVMLELLDKFEEVQHISSLVDVYSFLTALNLLLMVLRVLKLTDFQPRLGIITRTLTRAITDIVHYLLVASSLFLCFATMAHISFGPILEEFANLSNSLNTCFMMVIGEVGINDKLMVMQGLQLAVAWVFFWLYIIIMYFILINFFVAFIVDSFSDHMSSGARSSSTVTHDLRDLVYDAARQCWALLRCRRIQDDTTIAAKLEVLASLTTGTKTADAGTADATGMKSAHTSQARMNQAGHEQDVEAKGGEIKTHPLGERLERLVLSVKERLSSDATADGGSVGRSTSPTRIGGVDGADDRLVLWASRGGSMEGDSGEHGSGNVGGRGVSVVVGTECLPNRERKTAASTSSSLPSPGEVHERMQAEQWESTGEQHVVTDGRSLAKAETALDFPEKLHAATRAGQPGGGGVDDGSKETEGVGTLAGRSEWAREQEDVFGSMAGGSRATAETFRTLSGGPLAKITEVGAELESSLRSKTMERRMPPRAKDPSRKVVSVVASYAADAARGIARHAIHPFSRVDELTTSLAAGGAGAGKLDIPGAVAAPAVPNNPTVQLAEMLGGLQAQVVQMEARFNFAQARMAAGLSQLAQPGPGPHAQHTELLLSHDMVPGPAQVGTQLQGEAGVADVGPHSAVE